MEREYLTASEAADYLTLATATLANRRSAGTGPIFSKLGTRVVYKRQDLDAWAMGQRRELAPSDVVLQAQAFVEWWKRAGGEFKAGWQRWATSKAFLPADAAVVQASVDRLVRQ
jgi:hypothetical protein